MRRISGLLFLLAWLMPATLVPAQENAPLRIGISLPLSGDASLLSEQFLRGARLALDTLSPERRIEIVDADDGCDPDLAQLAAQDLRTLGVNIITGFLCSNAAASAAAELAGSGIPLLVAGARADYIVDKAAEEGWNLWRMAPGETDGAQAAGQILSERWRATPWAIVDDGTIYGRTLSEEIRTYMEGAGLPPQFVETFRPGQINQAALLRRLREAGIGALFVAASAQDTARIWREAHESDLRFEVCGGESLSQLPWIEEASDLPDGLLAIKPPDPEQLEQYQDVAAQMDRAAIEPEPYAFLGYAAAELALAALRHTPEATTRTLQDTVFRTVIGNVAFDPAGRNQIGRYRLYRWKSEGFTPVEPEAR